MTEKDSIFLTMEQALEAVCLDFQQYDPQILLFSEVIGVLSKGSMTVKRETGKDGLWIHLPAERRMRWFEGTELISFMCDLLVQSKLKPKVLAAVCARVFQTHAFPEKDPANSRSGIRILTGMQDFVCQQCGRCCRTLDYHNALTPEDVAAWQQTNRTDILEWVGIFPKADQDTVYRIWMTPGTRKLASICPFLQKIPDKNQWVCRIHTVKPQICRQYPVSRKHAIMTGCPGFDTQ